jgi:Cu2+-exporting ATPase
MLPIFDIGPLSPNPIRCMNSPRPVPPIDTPGRCFHCGQDIPAGVALTAEIDGRAQPMCCRGCQAVAEAIVAGGLSEYYRYRTENAPTARDPVPEFLRQTAAYDNPTVQKSFVRPLGGTEREASLILEGIVCAACVWLNERHLASLPGVLEVAVNYSTQRARVRWDESRIHLSRILQAVSEIGYLAHPYDPSRAQEVFERERRGLLRRLVVAGAFGMQVMILAVSLYAGTFTGIEEEFRTLFDWLSLALTLPVLGYSAQPFFRSALRDLRRRRPGMDVPVSLGLTIAFTGSVWATVTGRGEVYYDSVVMFVFFLLTGRVFEMAGRKRAAEASETLVHMLPMTATRIQNGQDETVPVMELAPGDRVRVRPGEAVPADGTVLEGRSSVDESLITGESLPLAKTAGEVLVGGTINMESPLVMRVDRTGEDTVLSSIMRLLERAQTEKPAIALSADRAATWFVARVLLLAAGVALFWLLTDPARWLPITVAVLVVTCPCALALATPVAITAATGRLMQRGLVTTRGHALETLARADTFIFDKTGTLTYGRPVLLEIQTFANLPASQCLALAAGLEQSSEHPIARALRAAAPDTPAAHDIINTPGAGLRGTIDTRPCVLGTDGFVQEAGISVANDLVIALQAAGQTVVWLGRDTELLAAFVIGDELRPGARELIAGLARQGKHVLLLTGDHDSVAKRVGTAVGIENIEAGLTPQDKLTRVQQLAGDGAIVAMIGDGINDAAALAGAHVSIAMGGGTQLAAASADLLLLSEQLSHLQEGITVARRTLAIIRQNMAWAVAYNLLALPFAAFGLIAPWMAALGMSASSLIVVANSLRLSEHTARVRLRATPTVA